MGYLMITGPLPAKYARHDRIGKNFWRGPRNSSAGRRQSTAQPIVNKFYWLRASRLETDRIVYWWANEMLVIILKRRLYSAQAFAVNEDKVRDYRNVSMLNLLRGLGSAKFEI